MRQSLLWRCCCLPSWFLFSEGSYLEPNTSLQSAVMAETSAPNVCTHPRATLKGRPQPWGLEHEGRLSDGP